MPLLAGNAVRLFLASATILFVELLLIRWVPANVTYVGFFSNFLLMASFLGIGLGILLGRRGWTPRYPLFALLLLGIVILVDRATLNVQLNSRDELFFGLAESRSADVNFLALPLVVALVATVMMVVSLPLGPLLRSMPPLRAYAVDIIGSLAGIAVFTTLSAAGTDPLVWFGVLAALLSLGGLARGVDLRTVAAGAVMVAVLVAVRLSTEPTDIWSPYYRIGTYSDQVGRTQINVNGIPHQAMHPVDFGGKEEFYEQVYQWFPGRQYERVLIVGAGSGSDTAIALARGAGHVDAVEIDPAIQELGLERHPDQPYQDPRVTRHTNDGRAFLRSSTDRYDLIVFALPDSLTLVSTTANVRLESFLFTEEAMASVRDHLSADGMFVLYNYYREPWLVAKLHDQLTRVFGHEPLLRLYGNVKATLAAGPGVAALGGAAPPGDGVDAVPVVGEPVPRPASDDWPFLYLRQPFIAPYYLVALGVILLSALAAVGLAARATGTTIRRFSPHFFVLGVAFLLLEVRSLVSFSLLFGTTWTVNALAFFAILASVLLAIFVNARFPIRRPRLLYLGLFAALGVAFLIPPESLLIDPPALRYGLAAVLAFAPVFFANLVFTHSFRDTATADMAFASNLLGAMLGGAMEYLALLTGYRALLIVVALLYGVAYLFATRFRFLADRDLTAAEDAPTRDSLGSPAPSPDLIPTPGAPG